jgi:hypothetical protein
MSTYLSTYLKNGGAKGAHFDQNKDSKEAVSRICLDPTQSDSYPILPAKATTAAPTSSTFAPYTTFPTNTAQFQDNVHMDFGSNASSTFASFSAQGQSQTQVFEQHPGQGQGQGQGTIDMSTYLTQMNMNSSTFSQAQGFGGYDYDYAKHQSQSYGMTGNGNVEAYISPESYSNTNPSYASSSRNFSGSSKTTPESTSLADPSPNCNANGIGAYFDGNPNNMNPNSKGTGGVGDYIQSSGEGGFAQLSEYLNRDGKGF